jgi:hypothetical protein
MRASFDVFTEFYCIVALDAENNGFCLEKVTLNTLVLFTGEIALQSTDLPLSK